VIFDLDGTLVDTADDFVPVVQQLREECGLPPMHPRASAAACPTARGRWSRLALGINEGEARLRGAAAASARLYGDMLGRHARPYPGMRDLLAALDSAASPGASPPTSRGLHPAPPRGAACSPGQRVCPEDVRQPKPHPESLHRICDALGCAPAQSVYVGDHARDIEAGRRAGLYTVAAAYGYIEDGDSAAPGVRTTLSTCSGSLAASPTLSCRLQQTQETYPCLKPATSRSHIPADYRAAPTPWKAESSW
jgi:phosphoglycolate phosphatase-like HAD superfamily hydrolase